MSEPPAGRTNAASGRRNPRVHRMRRQIREVDVAVERPRRAHGGAMPAFTPKTSSKLLDRRRRAPIGSRESVSSIGIVQCSKSGTADRVQGPSGSRRTQSILAVSQLQEKSFTPVCYSQDRLPAYYERYTHAPLDSDGLARPSACRHSRPMPPSSRVTGTRNEDRTERWSSHLVGRQRCTPGTKPWSLP